MKLPNILKNLGVFLGGCLVALLVLEVLLRVYNPLEIRFKPDRIVLPVNKHYILNNVGKFTKLPPKTRHTNNRLGFRGEPPPRNFGDYLTIITIGGSTTECFYPFDGQTWPDLLGRNLAHDFHRVWINNAGLDGATTYGISSSWRITSSSCGPRWCCSSSASTTWARGTLPPPSGAGRII
jgi:hypothetical protein